MEITIIVKDANHIDLGKTTVRIEETNDTIFSITINNEQYYSTGKTGTNIKTNAPVIEMATEDDARLWIDTEKTTIWMD